MSVCTIIHENYVAHAKALFQSLETTNPKMDRFVLVLADVDRVSGEFPNEVVLFPSDLGIDPLYHQMYARYSPLELSTAVKPFLLAELLRRGYSGAVYLDPDILVLHEMTRVEELLGAQSIVLTPHCLTPMPRDGLSPSERDIMRAGIFNLGYIGVSIEAEPFLEWWGERLTDGAFVDPDNGLFTDQRWIDWVPSLFDFTVLKDWGYNVAYWNLHERQITRGPESSCRHCTVAGKKPAGGDTCVHSLLSNGEPLVFFHFSGFNPLRADKTSKHFADNLRTDVSDNSILLWLYQEYANTLLTNGWKDWSSQPLPPSPSQIRLNPQADLLKTTAAVLRLVRRFFLAVSREGFSVAWQRARSRIGQALGKMPRDMAQPQQSVPAQQSDPSGRTASFTLVRYSSSAFGVGQAGDRVRLVLDALNVETTDTRIGYEGRALESLPGVWGPTLACVNADSTRLVQRQLGVPVPREHPYIGYWFWELEDFPGEFIEAKNWVSEVWVASRFIQESLKRAGITNVNFAPLPLFIPQRHDRQWSPHLTDTRKPYFLAVGDLQSVPNRKNLIGAIQAYSAAFGESDGFELVIKVRVSDAASQHAFEELKSAAAIRSDIHFNHRQLSQGAMQSLLLGSECFISLHRSEGLGLNIADAMAHGVPTVVTNYGGNVGFHPPDFPFAVDYRLTAVGHGNTPYPVTAQWADPDIDHAAHLLKRIADDPEGAHGVGQQSREHLATHFSAQAVGQLWRPLLQRITNS